MANATQAYKRSLSGSVGAGMGSLFNGGGKTYFILEHKVSSKYHKAGEAQEIIVDQVELGRSPECAVRFDESFNTVSRRHAAIVRDGANWKLVQLSTTNTTFLNGHPVQKEWYLQNGDEIQLAVNGPKLGFLIPTGKKSTVGSIGLSRRLSLFRQQALRPYRTAMYIMAAVIVLLICGGVGYGYWDYQNDLKREQLSEQRIAEAQSNFDRQMEMSKAREDSLVKNLDSVRVNLSNLKKTLSKSGKSNSGNRPVVNPTNSSQLISKLEPYVYYVFLDKIKVSYEGKDYDLDVNASGTGFLLNDGRFITARHVVEPWCFLQNVSNNEGLRAVNIMQNMGATVVAHLTAYSPNGSSIELVSTNAKINRSNDEDYVSEDGNMKLTSSSELDYAIFHTGKSGGLKADNSLSSTLPVGTELMILGYPLRLGSDVLSPLYSKATVAKKGLYHGVIMTTATTYESGNSGGPVFAVTNGNNAVVVGIVSATIGSSTGFIVPISSVK